MRVGAARELTADDLGGAEESLADVAADLGRLNLKQHAANRGSEGRVAPKEPRVRGGEPGGVSGVCSQPCQYGGGGIVCAGCTAAFALGERMESRGLGFVHARPACRGGADAAMVTLAEEERGRAAAPDVFFGVYSTVDAATRQRPQGGLRLRARLKGRMQASSARSGQRLVQREPGPGALARARDSVTDSSEQGPGARQKLGGEVLWTAR